jgi:hypothetical protein
MLRLTMPDERERPSAPLLILAIAAMAAGIYGRFKGLGFAPVSPDEYYLARGIDGILKHGFPAFDCGGIYQRGLALQYLIAGVRLTGLSVELSSRVVCALASLATLPAVYIVGRRFLSANGALAAVTILALSVWEIEVARFGRMYAPFQAIFAWYLVYFLSYTIDRNSRALRAMVALTVAGMLTWEGGVFLALANFVPALITYVESRRLEKRDWLLITIMLPLLVAAYFFATADLRYASAVSPYPIGFSRSVSVLAASKFDLFKLPALGVTTGYLWLGGFALVLAVCILSLRWVWSQRRQPLAAMGLLGMLAAALMHQFLLVAAIAVVLALLEQIPGHELRGRPARVFYAAIGTAGVFWLAYGLATVEWPRLAVEAASVPRALAVFAYQFMRIPNIAGNIIHPFAGAVPLLGTLLLVGLTAQIARNIVTTSELRSPERVLILLFTLLVLTVGLSHLPRQETRYVVFLYPLAVLLVVAAIGKLVSAIRLPGRAAVAAPALAALASFAVTEDISYHHIVSVDSPATTFRIGMKPALQAHLEIRDDVREIAQWLQAHVSPDTDVVINGVHGLDYYYASTKYFFADRQSSMFTDWSCRGGTVDRWTNLPLIYSFDDLKAKASQYKRSYLVTFNLTPEQLRLLADRNARVVLTRGWVSLIAME